ncbi:SMC-Scp complex subunit ScpB [Patescibacteria group bacterium]|nr:SMC-Scp complex subunit ScpB [Patescibacteria group bacterium]
MQLEQLIEALLFFKGEPMKINELVKLTKNNESDVKLAVVNLGKNLDSRGVVLMEKDGEVALGTSPEASETIEEMRQIELSRDIGKAGLETLAIVIYKGPVARSEIDYIRGVNSTFTLRNLMIRGLVERKANPTDARGFLYKPTLELLAFLGVGSMEDLPRYLEVEQELKTFVSEFQNNNGSR